jgi:hypothetical protein
LLIVDQEDGDWWKTEKAGMVFLVPASYFEVIGQYSSKLPTPSFLVPSRIAALSS